MCFFSNVLLFYYHYYLFPGTGPTLGFWVIWLLIMFQNYGKKIYKIHIQAFILLHFMYLSL